MSVISTFEGASESTNWSDCVYYDASCTYTSFDPITSENEADAGIYMLIILDMLYNDLPLIFRIKDNINHFRNFYGYYLLNDERLAINS